MKNRDAGVGSGRSSTPDAGDPATHESTAHRLLRTIDALTEGLLVQDHLGAIVDCNPAAQRILGLTPEQLAGLAPRDPQWRAIHEDGSVFPEDTYPSRLTRRDGTSHHDVVMGIHKPDGTLTWIAVTAIPFLISESARMGVLCTFRDITPRKNAEAAEHEGRVRLEMAARAGEVGFWDWDLLSDVVVYSTEWKRQIGFEPHEIENRYEEWEARLHPDDHDAAIARVQDYLAGRAPDYELEFRLRHRDGTYRWIFTRGELHRDATGLPKRFVGSHIDVTERKLAERAVLEQREQLVLAMELASLGRWEFDPVARHISLDDAFLRMLRTSADAQGGRSMALEEYIRRFLPADSTAALTATMNDAATAPGLEQTRQLDHQMKRADGTLATVSMRFVLVRDTAGAIQKCYGIIQDITARKEIETRLTRLLEGESLLATMSQRFIETDLLEFDTVILESIRAMAEFVGAVRAILFLYSPDGSRVLSPYEWCLDPADSLLEQVKGLKAGELGYFHEELKALRVIQVQTLDDIPKDTAERRWAEANGFRPMILLPVASRTRLIGTFIVYGRWHEERTFDQDLIPLLGSFAAALAHAIGRRTAEEERVFLERQLFQSQKLEAIGTLAGGIAHDFNNILTAIVGNLELARMDAESGLPVDRSLSEIETAADRATALVQQILAFSRHHQHERRVIALPSVVAEAIRLVRATIPAVVTIDVAVGPGVPHVLADPTQMHQILINLCANGWHAMNDAPGTITIAIDAMMLTAADAARIGGIEAGPCARVTVRDTGSGMDEELQRRIFEPFFTTKPVGKGTGLGMSVVFGIVRTHQGGITVESAVGKGTTVRVYIPAASAPLQRDEPTPVTVMGQGERLLVLDDETALARVMSQALERLGYRVTAFSEPADAIAAFQRDPESFDLVIADYEMPDVTGLAVAGALLRIRPSALIVLWSGRFSPDIRSAAREAGIKRLVMKPCEPRELSRVIREVLQQSRAD